VAVIRIAPEILYPDSNDGRVKSDEDCNDHSHEYANPEPPTISIMELVTSVDRKAHRVLDHRAPPTRREVDRPDGP
jgi:hypothetical protein